jgi:leader peptidase (prepilin peptidase) / N-methyltransferase
METWGIILVLALGLASGEALAAYAGWIVRCRRSGLNEPLVQGAAAAMLANGAGWLMACLLGKNALDAVELGLMVSASVVFTLVDFRIRVVPNELVAALLCLSALLAWMESGPAAFPGRIVGLLAALTLFLLAMLIAGPGKVGWGDVKLGAAVGFAAGFPGVLMAVLVMALLASLTAAVCRLLKRTQKGSPMPFAGFLTAGMVVTLFMDRAGALGFMK